MLTLIVSVCLFIAAGIYILVSTWQRHQLLAREQSIEYMQRQVARTLEAWHEGVIEAGQVKAQLAEEFAKLLRGKNPPPVGRMTFVTSASLREALTKALLDVPVVAMRSVATPGATEIVYVMFHCDSQAKLATYVLHVTEAGFEPRNYSFGC
jgi:hypothetical protein